MRPLTGNLLDAQQALERATRRQKDLSGQVASKKTKEEARQKSLQAVQDEHRKVSAEMERLGRKRAELEARMAEGVRPSVTDEERRLMDRQETDGPSGDGGV